ncbi:MAG TPA: phosphatase PAP2 family protein [Anaerolineae bacterium]|nr:phosphatase PAP2 family protein [Anaerolineae bacterium]
MKEIKRVWAGSWPSDRITLGIILVVWGTITARWLVQPGLAVYWGQHLAILMVFVGCVAALVRYEGADWVIWARGLLIINTMFVLYYTLGFVAFDVIPWLGDPYVLAWEKMLFGRSMSVWIEPYTDSFFWVEFFAFVYGAFIPFVYLSLFFSFVGRSKEERVVLITGFSVLYALSFLGYLFVPAKGPIVYQAGAYLGEIEGGFFHSLVLASIESAGGPHGAFPSLHVGATFFYCFFDLRYNFLRGLTYLPFGILIAVATLVMRYHYAIDAVVGIILAMVAIWAGQKLSREVLA